MDIKYFFNNIISKKEKKDEETHTINESSFICISNTDWMPLSEAGSLSEATSILAKGVWGNSEFETLRHKLRKDLPLLSANISLLQVDLSGVEISEESSTLNLKKLFSYCINLNEVILPDASSYKGNTNFHATFQGCNKLKQVPNFHTYKHITDLSSTFCFCYLLTEVTILAKPFPKGDKGTFNKVCSNLKMTIPHGTKMPSEWIQIKPENVLISHL